MKWAKKGMFVLFVLGMLVLVKADPVQAKELKEGKSYSVDLDGDGTKEKVKFTEFEAVKDEKYAVRLYVNGKKLATVVTDDFNMGAAVSVIDIDKKDAKKEIYVQFSEESDCFAGGEFYRYTNGKLKKYCTFQKATSSRLFIMKNQPGNGMVYFISEYCDTYVHQGYVNQAYRVSSGKLIPSKKVVLSTTDEWRKNDYEATRALKVYDSIGDEREAFTMETGDIFHIYKIKVKNSKNLFKGISYFYVRTEDGREGWVKNPGKDFFIGRYAGTDEWWKEAFLWG